MRLLENEYNPILNPCRNCDKTGGYCTSRYTVTAIICTKSSSWINLLALLTRFIIIATIRPITKRRDKVLIKIGAEFEEKSWYWYTSYW